MTGDKMNFDETKLKEIIRKAKICNEVELKDDTRLVEDLAMDSIAIIGIIVEIEEVFGINLENQMEMEEDSMVYGILCNAVKKAIDEKK